MNDQTAGNNIGEVSCTRAILHPLHHFRFLGRVIYPRSTTTVQHGTEEARIEVSADELLIAIAEGRDVDRVVVGGNLDVREIEDKLESGMDGRKILSGNIKIQRSVVSGKVSFGRACLAQEIDFTGTKIDGDADFWGTLFNDTAIVTATIFGKGARFNGALFRWYATFREANFADYRH